MTDISWAPSSLFSIHKTTSFGCLQLAQKPRSLPSGFLLFLSLHSFQRLLQLLRGQSEVWASLKWQAAWNSKSILKQHLGSKLTYECPQIAKWWGNIQYAHDGSCRWRRKFGANNTLVWASFHRFVLSLIEAESRSKRWKITIYSVGEWPNSSIQNNKESSFSSCYSNEPNVGYFTLNQDKYVPWILCYTLCQCLWSQWEIYFTLISGVLFWLRVKL